MSSPKRVLFLQGSSNFGGSKRALLNLVEALPSAGFEPVVACPESGWLSEELERRQTRCVFVPFFAWRKLLERPRVLSSIQRKWLPALEDWKFDIIHSNEFWWGPHALLFGRELGTPAIVHLRDGHHDLRKAKQYRLPEADAVIASSTELREKFAGDPVLYRKTRVLYDGHDPERFQFRGDRRMLRKTFGLEPEILAVGNVGRLCERKDQRLLLEAMARLKRTTALPPFRIFFAGEADPDYEKAMRADAAQLNLDAEVSFLGRIDDMAGFFAAMDLIVHTARREGFSLAVAESLLAGKPVVSTAVEGARDAIPDDRHGLVVPVGDEEALAGAIGQMLTDDSVRSSAATYAAQRAHRLLTSQVHRDQVSALYRELIGARQADRPA